MIAFACGGCGQVLQVDDGRAGRKAWCQQCGGVTRVPAANADPASEPEARPAGPSWGGVERDGWVALAVGLALAMVPLLVPLVAFLLFPLKTIVHECGHTATAWLLASPAFPQFDLTYGGGYSHVYARHPMLVVTAYLILAGCLFRARGSRPALVGWIVALAAYTVVMTTALRDVAILAMGHGAELVMAAVFLFRALGGRQILSATERPLYAALGLYLVLADGRFAVGLVADSAARTDYGNAKGGGHWMDFDRIAKTLGWPLQAVAGVFLLACVVTPVAAYLAHRYGDRLLPGRRAAVGGAARRAGPLAQ